MAELIEVLRLARPGRVAVERQEFTAIDVETTALHPGRVIEVAAVRMRCDGTILGELSTLVNPGAGVDPGATWVHHITREQLDGAPPLRDVVGHLVELCRDSVVVAHNLPFEERFLLAEFTRLGLRMPRWPGVCTLSAARSALRLPNYRLATVVDALDLPAVATHAALDDARACGQLMARLVTSHGLGLSAQPRFGALPRVATAGRCAPRVTGLRAGERGWMANLMDRLPISGLYPADAALEAAYLDLLSDALADGRITEPEAKALAIQVREAGMSAQDVRRLHTGVVRAMRQLAERDGVITAKEHRDLTRAADALGVPELVADLAITEATTTSQPDRRRPRVLVLGNSVEAAETRARLLAEGLSLAKNLTASVTHLVADHTVDTDDSRRHRAVAAGIPVLTAADVPAALGYGKSETLIARPVEPSSSSAVAVFEPATAPIPVPIGMVPAAQPSPAPPVRRRQLRQWPARLVMGVAAFLYLTVVLAAIGGAPANSLITTAVVATIVLSVGLLLRRRAAAERSAPPGTDRTSSASQTSSSSAVD